MSSDPVISLSARRSTTLPPVKVPMAPGGSCQRIAEAAAGALPQEPPLVLNPRHSLNPLPPLSPLPRGVSGTDEARAGGAASVPSAKYSWACKGPEDRDSQAPGSSSPPSFPYHAEMLPFARLCGSSVHGGRANPGAAATYCATSSDVNQSISILEGCKWRVILEHGLAGEVVSLAAFAPGSDSAPHTPVTPMTPSALAAAPRDEHGRRVVMHDLFADAPAREGGGVSRVHTPCLRYSGGHVGTSAPRFAWASTSPHAAPSAIGTSPPSHVMPLRRGSPPVLWSLLHAFGLRDFEAGTGSRARDCLAHTHAILLMITLVGQIGLLLLHWCDATPVQVRAAPTRGTPTDASRAY